MYKLIKFSSKLVMIVDYLIPYSFVNVKGIIGLEHSTGLCDIHCRLVLFILE
jgi:hypothetical protein